MRLKFRKAVKSLRGYQPHEAINHARQSAPQAISLAKLISLVYKRSWYDGKFEELKSNVFQNSLKITK